MSASSVVVIAITVHLGILLSVSGTAKAADVRTFSLYLSLHQVLPRSSIQALSRAVPVAEIIIGVFLLGGLFPKAALLTCLALLTLFLVYRATLYRWGASQAECGCHGPVALGNPLAESIALMVNGVLGLVAFSPAK